MTPLLVYTFACIIYGMILATVFMPPLYNAYARHRMACAARRILAEHEKSQV